jgi:hypothetical protein
MRRRIVVGPAVLAFALALVGAGCVAAQGSTGRAVRAPRATAASTAICGTQTTVPKYKHVIVLFMENQPYASIQSSSFTPYIHSLENSCGLATNYHNITHPSLPEYIAATTGASFAQLTGPPASFETDCSPSTTCKWSGNNIFNQVQHSGRLWKSYAESMPGNCGKANAGLYAPRHNPAVYDTDLTNCSSRVVPLGTTSNSPLLKDFSSESTAPAYSWITPNLCDDMHGAGGCPSNLVQTGDNWLKLWIPKITSSAVYKKHDTVIFLTWDEGELGDEQTGEQCYNNTSDESCRVVFIPIAPSVRKGARVAMMLNHWSLLKASEDLLGVPELGQAKTANSLLAAFHL